MSAVGMDRPSFSFAWKLSDFFFAQINCFAVLEFWLLLLCCVVMIIAILHNAGNYCSFELIGVVLRSVTSRRFVFKLRSVVSLQLFMKKGLNQAIIFDYACYQAELSIVIYHISKYLLSNWLEFTKTPAVQNSRWGFGEISACSGGGGGCACGYVEA
ncbi:hypothetical protein T01_15591 [Trichinella spiralis]|uniref:Uncharacterized protein n=1 Tax=Trichinella spiralis TaxID=6334 RepID=A0A0V1AVL8_TRISP|nr:hypothetical protein T01_15591 [Trichinella spiralis]